MKSNLFLVSSQFSGPTIPATPPLASILLSVASCRALLRDFVFTERLSSSATKMPWMHPMMSGIPMSDLSLVLINQEFGSEPKNLSTFF